MPGKTLKRQRSLSGGRRVRQKAFSSGNKSARTLLHNIIRSVGEKKEVTVYAQDIAAANTVAGRVAIINAIAEGTDYNNRVGRKATLHSIEGRLQIQNQLGTGTAYPDAGFWALVYDRQPTGTLPVFSDIFDTTTSGAAAGVSLKVTYTYQDRWIILRQDEWACNSGGFTANGGAGTNVYRTHFYIDMSKYKEEDRQMTFSSAAGSTAAIDKGALYFVWCNSVAEGAGNSPACLYNIKTRFTDL